MTFLKDINNNRKTSRSATGEKNSFPYEKQILIAASNTPDLAFLKQFFERGAGNEVLNAAVSSI